MPGLSEASVYVHAETTDGNEEANPRWLSLDWKGRINSAKSNFANKCCHHRPSPAAESEEHADNVGPSL